MCSVSEAGQPASADEKDDEDDETQGTLATPAMDDEQKSEDPHPVEKSEVRKNSVVEV